VTDDIPVPEGYRIEPFGQEGGPTAEDLLNMWVRGEALDADTAGRRVHEVVLVAIGPGEELAGAISAHLERSRQLLLNLWHLATFVERAHRKAYVGAVLTLHARDHLAQRHAAGDDQQGAGVVLELQHQQLRAHLDKTERAGFTFVGQTHGGHARWIDYFPGVLAPQPPAAAAPAEPVPAAPAATAPPPREVHGPVFVVAAPGSGAVWLRDALADSADLVAVDGDRAVAQAAPGLDPSGPDGSRLDDAAATPEVAAALREALAPAAGEGRPLVHGVHHAVRVPFLQAVFPDATFVFLHRDPAEAVPAALAGWESGEQLRAPGWRSLRDVPLPEVVAAQWEAATRIAVADLQRLSAERWSVADHATVCADPADELARLARFAGVRWEPEAETPPPVPEEAPAPAGEDVRAALRRTRDTAAVARTLFASEAPPAPAAAPTVPAPADGAIRSAATDSLAAVLAQIHASLLVSAPRAGTVAVVRRAGEGVNTHLTAIAGATGMAARDDRLAIATPYGVAGYRDIPSARTLLPGNLGRDACFVPHRLEHTGDLGAGEVAYAGDELWLVATRFSCLATLDDRYSFVPRWRPPFVTELAAEDRCHLSGLSVVDDQVRYVTALGATDTPRGWRDGVEGGGVVIDVRDDRTVASGLAMPFSPRWHRDRLWVLLAREGALAVVDPGDGTVEIVARVPGFARGLALHGSLAFVGVSALRGEADNRCGVWVVDVGTGATVAFQEFTAGVDEVADVHLLPGLAFPEVVAAGSDAARNAFVLPPP
jgi:uncharacterized protein (TIGR03032 family)